MFWSFPHCRNVEKSNIVSWKIEGSWSTSYSFWKSFTFNKTSAQFTTPGAGDVFSPFSGGLKSKVYYIARQIWTFPRIERALPRADWYCISCRLHPALTQASAFQTFGSSRMPKENRGWNQFLHIACAAGIRGEMIHGKGNAFGEIGRPGSLLQFKKYNFQNMETTKRASTGFIGDTRRHHLNFRTLLIPYIILSSSHFLPTNGILHPWILFDQPNPLNIQRMRFLREKSASTFGYSWVHQSYWKGLGTTSYFCWSCTLYQSLCMLSDE